jgi:uncharacterized protein YbjT (DUF2867 family)
MSKAEELAHRLEDYELSEDYVYSTKEAAALLRAQDEAIKLALDALEWAEYLAKNSELSCQTGTWTIEKAIAKLREALK